LPSFVKGLGEYLYEYPRFRLADRFPYETEDFEYMLLLFYKPTDASIELKKQIENIYPFPCHHSL
jgi:hypothetical protein